MERGILMQCGCVAQGTCSSRNGEKIDPPIPACVVHDCYDPAPEKPDLTGRVAECAYLPRGHADRPSSYDLAFFEYRGPGSREATQYCKCGMSRTAHDDAGRIAPRKYAMLMRGCAGFTAKGPQNDKHYCGCHGWD